MSGSHTLLRVARSSSSSFRPRGHLIELEIDSLAAGGEGVARGDDARVVFIPYTAPGDRIRARIVEERRRFSRAVPVEVLRPGPDRVEASCELFANRTCGGCQWQHLDADAQARAKQRIVESALRHFVAAGMALDPILTPVPAYGWRRQARLHWFRPKGADAAVVGFFAPQTHRVTRVNRCPQISEPLVAALEVIQSRLTPGLHKRGEVYLLAGVDGRVHVAIRGPCGAGVAAALAESDPVAGVTARRRSWGAKQVEVDPGLVGSADRFAQSSAVGNKALVEVVDAAVGPRSGASVLELFAGSGNLTRVLQDGANRVVAVDVSPPPQRAGTGRVQWVKGNAAYVAARLADSAERFDVAVLDPPRTGAADVMASLAKLRPSRIVYVSCDPATLARDLKALVDSGYHAVRAVPLDLMPQTAHVEVVATLERES